MALDLAEVVIEMEPIRPLVHEIVRLGRMPTTAEADSDEVRADRWEGLVGELRREGGVTNAEAATLAGLFPSDGTDSYGMTWTLLHLVESAPGWPIRHVLDSITGPWSARLRQRADAAQ